MACFNEKTNSMKKLLNRGSGFVGYKKNKIYGRGLVGNKVVGDEYVVEVGNIWNASDGLPLAEKHCQLL